MADDFVHLRVASCYSLQYGVAQPADLVQQAAQYGQRALALTDRDGLSGAVQFVRAAQSAGLAPIIGVDLATAFSPFAPAAQLAFRQPRTGAPNAALWRAQELGAKQLVDLPRVVVYAAPTIAGASGISWAGLCRLVTLAKQRPAGQLSPAELADFAQRYALIVQLGADSAVGGLAAGPDLSLAEQELARWHQLFAGSDQLVIGLCDHGGPAELPYSTRQAARMLGLAKQFGYRAVLTNQVRILRREQARVADVLDSARNLMPLSKQVISRVSAEGWLKPGALMQEVSERISLAAGESDGVQLLAATRQLAEQLMLEPVSELGLGSYRMPAAHQLKQPNESYSLVLRGRCEAALAASELAHNQKAADRLADELAVIKKLAFEPYFLTVAKVKDLADQLKIRCTARGSGVGSLVNYLLKLSAADPIANGLLMERFLTLWRQELPDIDLDVESARRGELYQVVFDYFGADQVACVGMFETYRVRTALRDVGRAIGLANDQIDQLAKSLPRVRASKIESALQLPELANSPLHSKEFAVVRELVQALDGLPKAFAQHPCGVIITDNQLGDYTPLETSGVGYLTSQFDKESVAELGLIKLDILGVRMQSAIAHSCAEISRTSGQNIELTKLAPYADQQVYQLIASSQTVGCFQIESPGQRELVGRFAPSDFNDLAIDISLFRPGPVKSDMVTPFLAARHGLCPPDYLDDSLREILAPSCGVVVFQEQIIELIAKLTGLTLAEADQQRRKLAKPELQEKIASWFTAAASARGYSSEVINKVWQVLCAFASFGFCKAHAVAFAVTTYESAWLKRYWPAHFMAGLLSHDPGMYPKRLLLAEARRMGITILPIDVNQSAADYRVQNLSADSSQPPRWSKIYPGLPDASGWAIRCGLQDVKGIDQLSIEQILAAQPYSSLADFWTRSKTNSLLTERLIKIGALDQLDQTQKYQLTRRDLLLELDDLNHRAHQAELSQPSLGLELTPSRPPVSNLPAYSPAEKLVTELELCGMELSDHLISRYYQLLDLLGVCSAARLRNAPAGAQVLVCGVKVASQTPPVRSGQRVIFLTLDDGTGLSDLAFFASAHPQAPNLIFGGWVLLASGQVRRSGKAGLSLTGARVWDLEELYQAWLQRQANGASPSQAVNGLLDRPASKQAQASAALVGRKLWQSSPGSSSR